MSNAEAPNSLTPPKRVETARMNKKPIYIGAVVVLVLFGVFFNGIFKTSGPNDKPVTPQDTPKETDIWTIWILAIAGVAIFVGGGFSSVDPFLGTEKGISIHSVSLMAVYYIVIGVIVTSSLLLGRRGFCHTLCWMAPFMVLGRKLANVLKLRSLRLSTNDNPCSGCGQCDAGCPMSLPVQAMTEGNMLEHADCTLCNICVSTCPNRKLMIGFYRPVKGSIDTHENE